MTDFSLTDRHHSNSGEFLMAWGFSSKNFSIVKIKNYMERECCLYEKNR